MGRYFSVSARHAKSREFLELEQGTTIVLEYVAKFIELARFTDDYAAIDMTKVRKFEDGLKLSIPGKIGGLLLQDMDLFIKIAMTIEREVDDAQSIRLKIRGRRANLFFLAQGRSRGLLLRKGFRDRATTIRAKARVNHLKMEDTSGLLAS